MLVTTKRAGISAAKMGPYPDLGGAGRNEATGVLSSVHHVAALDGYFLSAITTSVLEGSVTWLNSG